MRTTLIDTVLPWAIGSILGAFLIYAFGFWFMPYLVPGKYEDAGETWRFMMLAWPVILAAILWLSPMARRKRA
jgi:hypothetical protein